MTTPEWTDAEVFEDLVDQSEGDTKQMNVDGTYGTRAVYEAARKQQDRLVAPFREYLRGMAKAQ